MILRLKGVLESKGPSLKRYADLLGVSEKTFYNKLTGATEFSYGEVRKLKAMLPEYDIDYLLSEAPSVGQDSA